jgi:hypothetical protein
MFLPTSDLSLIVRREIPYALGSPILASGLAGTWVTVSGTGQASFPASPTLLAWPIWNESQRDQAIGKWGPDVLNTQQVTVLAGKGFFARTSVFTGSPTIGQGLEVDSLGRLAYGATYPVAYVMKAPYALTYLGVQMTVMDIYVG